MAGIMFTAISQAAINIPPYVKHKTVMKTTNSDPMKFISVQTSCDEYKYSFWPLLKGTQSAGAHAH